MAAFDPGVPVTQLIGYGLIPAVVVCGVVLATLLRPQWIVFGLLGLFILRPDSTSFGVAAGGSASLLYVYGINTFFYPIFFIVLLFIWLGVVVLREPLQPWHAANPARWAYVLFTLLLFGHLFVDILDVNNKHFWIESLSPRGVAMVVWQGAVIAIFLSAIREPRDVSRLFQILLVLVPLNHLWFLFRYAFLGGDPQNAYAVLEKTSIKITFWDTTEGLLATFVVCAGLWRILVDRFAKRWQALAWSSALLICGLVVVLSARRNAQIGMALGLLSLAWFLPRNRKGVVILLIVLLAPAAVLVTAQRNRERVGSVIEAILLDARTSRVTDNRNSRSYESKVALRTVRQKPWFGWGPTASFQVRSDQGIEFHKGDYSYVHSGPVHLLLKVGVVGLGIYLAGLASLMWFGLRHVAAVPVRWRAYYVGGFAAFVAGFPNFLVATAMVDMRMMLVWGLFGAVPLLCVKPALRQASVMHRWRTYRSDPLASESAGDVRVARESPSAW